jgi:TRAP-type mannitol/chloroaromatic compound transport system permease small subunit
LVVGLTLMIIVGIELVIRSIIIMMGGEDALPVLNDADMAGAE